MRQEPEHAHPVIDSYDHHTTTSQVRPIDAGRCDRPEVESATVDPDHDREPVAAGLRRSPDVERETVLACGPTQRTGAGGWRSGTPGSEPRGISYPCPRLGR